ncbi:MAG: NAD-dependent epimerase/dehydratase family protein [Planctomycetes bacterium]|nr:NAD-dependent epimerase/dehydratase family protein [Planctomycetota bacterium]
MCEKAMVVVTGGSGFIGRHVCQGLIASGYRVRVLDIEEPMTPLPGVDYEIGDVCQDTKVRSTITNATALIHLAAMVSVPECQERPEDSYRVNVMSVATVLEAIRRESVKSGRNIRFLFSSSSAVYGTKGDEGGNLVEDQPLDPPISLYGVQKLAAERMVRLYNTEHGIPGVVFRFFNVFGSGQRADSPYSGVISQFRRRILEGEPLVLNGGGRQTRDFISVTDVVCACLLALRIHPSNCDAKPINLGTGRSLSIKALAHIMMNQMNRTVELRMAPPRKGDVLHSRADIARAFKVLHWRPSMSFDAALLAYLGFDALTPSSQTAQPGQFTGS